MKLGIRLSQTLTYLVCCSLIGILIVGCDSSASYDISKAESVLMKPRQDIASSEISSTQNEVNSEFRKFVREAELKLKVNEVAILALKEKVLLTDSNQNLVLADKFNILESGNKQLSQALETYVIIGDGNWKDFKNEFYRNLEKLQMACEDVSRTENSDGRKSKN